MPTPIEQLMQLYQSVQSTQQPVSLGPANMDPNFMMQMASHMKGGGFGPREYPFGGQKGLGFFGKLQRPDGGFSTELSASANVGGKEMLFPLLVPTLRQDQIQHLLSGAKPTDEIYSIAIQHALERSKQGKSPFAGFGEQVK